LLLIIVLMVSAGAFAQIETPVKWAFGAKRISPTEAVVFARATIDDGWHIYALDVKDGGPVKTSFTFPPSKDYVLVGKTSQPAPISKYEPSFKMDVTYFEKTVIFQQKIKLKNAGAAVVKGSLEYETCNDHKCLPPDDVDFTIPIGK
jgi:hypothetical protein